MRPLGLMAAFLIGSLGAPIQSDSIKTKHLEIIGEDGKTLITMASDSRDGTAGAGIWVNGPNGNRAFISVSRDEARIEVINTKKYNGVRMSTACPKGYWYDEGPNVQSYEISTVKGTLMRP